MYKTGAKGIELIKGYEDCKLTAYQDNVGVWTIGWGNTLYLDGTPVKKGDRITQQEADELFDNILKAVEKQVNRAIAGIVLKQNQFDALMSFTYNEGIDNLRKSTLLKRLKANPNDAIVPSEFAKWIYAGGKILRGLVNRRKSESLLFSTGALEFFY